MLTNKPMLITFFFLVLMISSVRLVYADTYTLNINEVCKMQNAVVACPVSGPGSPNITGHISNINAGTNEYPKVTDPDYVGTNNTRWVLDGYVLDGAFSSANPINGEVQVSILMQASHNLTWYWHKEILLSLTANFGSPQLSGEGWQKSNSTVQISAPQVFFVSNSQQYFFRDWVANNTVISTNPTTTVTVGDAPLSIQAIYILVSSSMTNTFTTTMTTVINGVTTTTTSTGVFAHDQVTVQLQILNNKLNLANANVTVLDDSGQPIYKGLTDQSGLTAQFQVKPTLIYTVKVQSLAQSYSTKQRFQTSGTYPVDVSGSQPLISLQAVGPWIIPIVGLVIGVIALIMYLASRRGPSKPHTEWVSR